MSRNRTSGLKNRVISLALATGLLTVPAVIALAEMDTEANFSLFSTIGVTEIPRHSVQERARKKLIRVQQSTEKATSHASSSEDTVSTDTTTTMIAQQDLAAEIDEIDIFPIILAAPTH